MKDDKSKLKRNLVYILILFSILASTIPVATADTRGATVPPSQPGDLVYEASDCIFGNSAGAPIFDFSFQWNSTTPDRGYKVQSIYGAMGDDLTLNESFKFFNVYLDGGYYEVTSLSTMLYFLEGDTYDGIHDGHPTAYKKQLVQFYFMKKQNAKWKMLNSYQPIQPVGNARWDPSWVDWVFVYARQKTCVYADTTTQSIGPNGEWISYGGKSSYWTGWQPVGGFFKKVPSNETTFGTEAMAEWYGKSIAEATFKDTYK